MSLLKSGRVLATSQLQRTRNVTTTALDVGVAYLARPRTIAFINGFPRSGSTWLQEALADATGSKTVFEPFNRNNRMYGATLRRLLPERSPSVYKFFMPGPGERGHWNELSGHMRRAVRGISPGGFGLMLRRSLLDSLRTTVVIKDLHSHFALPLIHDAFKVPIIHISRHPGAVFSSLRRTTWGWDLTSTSLEEILGACGVVSAESPWLEPVRWADQAGRHAEKFGVFWAICEETVRQELENKAWARIVQYEDLVDEPASAFDGLLKHIGTSPSREYDLDRPSVSTSSGRREISPEQRRDDWKSDLSSEELRALREAVSTVSPDLSGRYF